MSLPRLSDRSESAYCTQLPGKSHILHRTAWVRDASSLLGVSDFVLSQNPIVFHLYSVRGHGAPCAPRRADGSALFDGFARTRDSRRGGWAVAEGTHRAVSREPRVGGRAEATKALHGSIRGTQANEVSRAF